MGGQPRCGRCKACLHPLSRRPCTTPGSERKEAAAAAALTGTEIRLYGQHSIHRRQCDGYLSATHMANACGKIWGNFNQSQRTKKYISNLTDLLGGTTIVDYKNGSGIKCTWIHPRLAVDFAQWLNAEFAVWIENWISLPPPLGSTTTTTTALPPTTEVPAAASFSDPDETTTDNEEPSSSSSSSQQQPPPSAAAGFEIRLYGEHSIQRRELDGFWNATSMASAFGKLWANYTATQRAKDYMNSLSKWLINSVITLSITEPILIDCRQGGSVQGTWIHPRLAIDFARWLNSDFAVFMDGWILESMMAGVPRTHPPPPPPRREAVRIHNALPETRGTGGVRPHLYVGIAPNLNVVKIGNTGNLQKRQSQHRTKPSRTDDTSTFHDKDYHHILTSEGYGHLDQLLLEMYSERRIIHTDDRSQRVIQTDRLRNTDIDVDVIIAVLPQLQEKWEATNPVQDDEHARGLKRRREEADVLLHEQKAEAEGTRVQGEAQAASISALAEANKAQAEADAIKAVTDSLVEGSLDEAERKLKIFEKLYRSGSRCV